MTGPNEKHGSLAELAALLEIWGGDTSRWPRSAVARLPDLKKLPGAAALFDEARAFDRMLDAGSDANYTLSVERADALADRIVAAAGAEAGRKAGEVIAFPSRAPSTHARTLLRPASIRSWPAAGLIAASLMLGIVIGGNLNVVPVMQELAEVAGLSSPSDPSLGDDLGEEDVL